MKKQNFKNYCIVLLMLICADLILTYIGIININISEMNPLYTLIGLNLFLLIKVSTIFIPIIFIQYFNKYPKESYHACIFLIIIYTIVFVNNIYVFYQVIL